METTILSSDLVDARVAPKGSLENLSQQEIAKLLDSGQGGLYPLFRKCALAVLNSGSPIDDSRLIFEKYKDFDLRIVRQAWGIKLEIKNAPAAAFVDGEMIRGLKDHLFAVLRDVVFISNEIMENGRFDLASSPSITNAVFHILRNARVLELQVRPNLVVCWGGHSIQRSEYDYTKKVGYELGLRGLDVCTGCGPGAMKGPMKGATIGHSKQRIVNGRYMGITEPGIIAAEPPNPIVSQLVIMPDIEKRLEAFVRLGHGVVVFPGGVGTAEEILYLIGILLDPANRDMPFPLIFTGPARTADYFEQIHNFIGATLGPSAQSKYQIIIDDPAAVARARATPTASTGCCGFRSNSSGPSRSRTRRCATCGYPRTNPCTSAPPTCAACFRVSWPATSRNTGSTPSRSTDRSNSSASERSSSRSTGCCAPSSRSTG